MMLRFGHDYDEDREQLLPLLPRRRLLLLRLEDTGVAPKIFFPRVHPNPIPYTYMPYFLQHVTYFIICHIIMSHFILWVRVN